MNSLTRARPIFLLLPFFLDLIMCMTAQFTLSQCTLGLLCRLWKSSLLTWYNVVSTYALFLLCLFPTNCVVDCDYNDFDFESLSWEYFVFGILSSLFSPHASPLSSLPFPPLSSLPSHFLYFSVICYLRSVWILGSYTSSEKYSDQKQM